MCSSDLISALLNENAQLDLPTAYKLAKADKVLREQTAAQEELAHLRDAAKQYGLKTSTGRNTSGQLKPPAGLKAHEIYSWYSKQKQAR